MGVCQAFVACSNTNKINIDIQTSFGDCLCSCAIALDFLYTSCRTLSCFCFFYNGYFLHDKTFVFIILAQIHNRGSKIILLEIHQFWRHRKRSASFESVFLNVLYKLLPCRYYKDTFLRGSVAQWVAHLTCNVEVVGSSPIKGRRCFLEQDTLPLLLSTGWFQERIRV